MICCCHVTGTAAATAGAAVTSVVEIGTTLGGGSAPTARSVTVYTGVLVTSSKLSRLSVVWDAWKGAVKGPKARQRHTHMYMHVGLAATGMDIRNATHLAGCCRSSSILVLFIIRLVIVQQVGGLRGQRARQACGKLWQVTNIRG